VTQSLRIAFVSAFPPGQLSLNEYGLHLARELAAHPDVAEVVVLADVLPQPLPELDLGPKVRVLRLWRFNSLGTLPKLLSTLRREKLDGVVFNLQTASFGDREATAALGLLAPMMARLMGTPSGVIAHNIIAGVDLETTILKGQRLRQAIVKLGGAVVTAAMTQASYLTTTLASYRDILATRYPRRDISLVPHGTFDTTPRVWIPLDQRPARIVTMGKFGTYKRLETLIAAFDLLRQDPALPGLELVIGGTDHPNTPGYMAGLAAAHGTTPGLRFHGYVAEEAIPEFFEGARVSVFDYESTTGSSGVLHQTASYGAVPVFPHIGDFVDVCRDEGLSGFNYAPGQSAAMADAIRHALVDQPAAAAIAQANRDAALGMPLAEVAAFHVDRIAQLSPRHRSAS
jgi:glycosyltransferase involved in cell wall biosynthesis